MSGNRTIFADLNQDRFVPVKLKKITNPQLVYVNYKLAKELGYSLDNVAETLANEYGWLVDNTESSSSLIGYADTYNASPFKPTKESGSGRGVFLENGGFLKGVGLTPLAPLKGFSLKTLNTGFCPIYEGIKEAIFGEFLHAQCNASATRILAVFDLGFKDDDGKNYTGIDDQGLIVRIGDHARIGHYTDGTIFKEFEKNIGKFRPIDDWQNYKMRFSFKELVQHHAKTLAAAEFMRFWHGAMDAGNTTLRGGIIDFGSATFQLDTAPRFWLDPRDYFWFSTASKEGIAKLSTFGYEYLGVADSLHLLYSEQDIEVFYLELKHQRLLQLLGIFGFTEKEADEYLSNPQNAEQLNSFYSSWWQLGRYFFWGDMDGRRSVADPLSLIDIFSYLRSAASNFCKMLPLPEIEVNKPASLKNREREFWQVDAASWAPYGRFGVQLTSSNELVFSSDIEKNTFLNEKAALNSKLENVFNSFISYWQDKNEDIATKKNLLNTTIEKRSLPFMHLSRGPLLKDFKEAYQDYKHHKNNHAIQMFIDQTLAVTNHATLNHTHSPKLNSIVTFFKHSPKPKPKPKPALAHNELNQLGTQRTRQQKM